MAEKRMFLKGLLWGSAACGEAHKKGNFLATALNSRMTKKIELAQKMRVV